MKRLTFDINGEKIIDEIPDEIFEPIWHRPERPIQVFLSHENSTAMILANPMLLAYMEQAGIPVFHELEGVYVYVNALLDEHKVIFENFHAQIKQ